MLGAVALAVVCAARIATRVYVARTPDLAGTTNPSTAGYATTGGAGQPQK